MTKSEFRYARHPDDTEYSTEELKREFPIHDLFNEDQIRKTYSMTVKNTLTHEPQDAPKRKITADGRF